MNNYRKTNLSTTSKNGIPRFVREDILCWRKAFCQVNEYFIVRLFIFPIIGILLVSVGGYITIPVSAEENPCRDSESVELNYKIDKGMVKSICRDRETESLIVSINATGNGTIFLDIPRKIMNQINSNCEDVPFFVLVNDEEIFQDRKNNFGIDPYVETKSIYSRTLQIPFKTESYKIEIMNYSFIPEYLQDVKTCQEKINSLPPKQQIMKGVLPEEIVCKEGLQLIFNSKNNSPACVKPQSAKQLVERGWGIIVTQIPDKDSPSKSMKLSNSDFMIYYDITGGNILEVKEDKQERTITISLDTTSQGMLTITLQKALIDSTFGNKFEPTLFVLVDKNEVNFEETATSADRTLTIQFPAGAETIRIIGPIYP